jgi:polyhydroxybutyrate depolymerase
MTRGPLPLVLLSLASAVARGEPQRDAGAALDGGALGAPDGRAPAVPAGDTPAAPRTITLSLVVDGKPRTVLVRAPAGARGPAALVLNLHGSYATAAAEEALSGMDATANAEGFVVAYPQAAIESGGGFEWHVPGQPLFRGGPAPADAPDDVAFIAQAIAAIEARFSIDKGRVFATGFSGGGRMASWLGCDLAPTVAAIAPVGGLRFPARCAGPRPVAVVALHGTADSTNPYAGHGPPTWSYGVEEAARRWARHDGCRAKPATSRAGAGVKLTHFGGCRDGTAVDLVTIEGGGHGWPSDRALDANLVIWKFFSAHARP